MLLMKSAQKVRLAKYQVDLASWDLSDIQLQNIPSLHQDHLPLHQMHLLPPLAYIFGPYLQHVARELKTTLP